MYQKNYLAITALALGCNIATAGDMGGGGCTSDNMTIPCNKASWAFEAQAVYLQPVYSNLANSFAGNEVLPSVSTPYSFSAPHVSPDWGWGFFLQDAYSFKNSKDITVDWLRMHNTSSTTKIVSSFFATTTTDNTPASFSFAPQLDAVNVVLGQTFNFDTKSSARLYGGVEYARLINNISNQYQNGSLYTNQSSSFNGAGPKVGVDLFYEPHFLPSRIPLGKIYAKGAASVLVGSQQLSTKAQGTDLYTITESQRNTQFIPALEGKIGLEGAIYTSQHGSTWNYDLNYAIYSYLNARPNAQAPIGASAGAGPGQTSRPNFVTTSTGGVAFQGVQFGLKYVAHA